MTDLNGSPEAVTPRHTWDTSYIPTQDRFAYFREGVCQTSLAITPEVEIPDDLQARMEKTDVRQGVINRIDITPLRVIRTNADVAKIPDEYLALTFQLTGDQTRLLNGKEHFDSPGQSHLIDCNLPIDIGRVAHINRSTSFSRERSSPIIWDSRISSRSTGRRWRPSAVVCE